MRASEIQPTELPPKNAKLKREGIERLRARVAQARSLKATIVQLADKFKRTGIRTDTEVEVISLAAFRLHEAIYMITFLKQALIRS